MVRYTLDRNYRPERGTRAPEIGRFLRRKSAVKAIARGKMRFIPY
jgi:hypothetical protein